jgi:hypothetical protein
MKFRILRNLANTYVFLLTLVTLFACFINTTHGATLSSDTILTTNLEPVIAVDLNRDGVIEFTKELHSQSEFTDRTTPDRPYRFWVNNDLDVVNHKGKILKVTKCSANPRAVPGTQYRQVCEQWDEPSDNGANSNTSISKSINRLKQIESYRDLEDFTPMAINLGTNNIGKNYYLKLSAKGVSINIFRGNWQAGEKTHGYIYDANKTEQQMRVANDYNGYVGQLNPSTPITLNHRDVYSLFDEDGVARVIFEGVDASASDCNQGGKECYVSVGAYRKNTTPGKGEDSLIAESRLYVNLYDVDDLYESVTAGNAREADSFGDYNAVYFGSQAIKRTQKIKVSLFQDMEDESALDKYYILLVHGWRMTEDEKHGFAQTAFKRLYWSGYKGRFGAFNWPTGWFDRAAYQYQDTSAIETLSMLTEILGNNQHYDISESVARRVGRDLIQKLHDGVLHAANEYHVFAHSMGNVVVSEAIRHDNPANPFFTSYSPSQAASVSGAYKQDQSIITHTMWGISEWGCTGGDEVTSEQAWRCYNNDANDDYDMPPDLYRFNLAEEDGGSLVIRHGPTTDAAMNALVGSGKPSYYDKLDENLKGERIVNYFNDGDAALNAWEFNQLAKPDSPDHWNYSAVPYADDRVTSEFKERYALLKWSDQVTEDSANILARLIPARTNALGQSNIDDAVIGIASQDLGFTNSNQDHSAQFHGYYSELSPYSGNNNAVRAIYWNKILNRSVELGPEDYSGLKNGLGME